MSLHVYPSCDVCDHEIEGCSCWCEPRIEWSNPETGMPYSGGPLVVHNQLIDEDGWRLLAEAERIKNRRVKLPQFAAPHVPWWTYAIVAVSAAVQVILLLSL